MCPAQLSHFPQIFSIYLNSSNLAAFRLGPLAYSYEANGLRAFWSHTNIYPLPPTLCLLTMFQINSSHNTTQKSIGQLLFSIQLPPLIHAPILLQNHLNVRQSVTTYSVLYGLTFVHSTLKDLYSRERTRTHAHTHTHIYLYPFGSP